MLGAIIGDMYGSQYEFNNQTDKSLIEFNSNSVTTDDSYMTLAISKALIDYKNGGDFQERCIFWLNNYGHMYPDGNYGLRFLDWLDSEDKKPYNSCGNGSAMRVSSVGWFCDSLEETLKLAELSASVTHNHPEGIKGAQAIAAGIFLLRTGSSKEEVKNYITEKFGYNLDRTVDDIRKNYDFYETCQKSVPEAIICFLEGTSYEDVVKTAISIGGDSDTIACIAGSLAEAIYPIPKKLINIARDNMNRKIPVHREFYFYRIYVMPKKNKLGMSDQSI